jgi:hypothetical protein
VLLLLLVSFVLPCGGGGDYWVFEVTGEGAAGESNDQTGLADRILAIELGPFSYL